MDKKTIKVFRKSILVVLCLAMPIFGMELENEQNPYEAVNEVVNDLLENESPLTEHERKLLDELLNNIDVPGTKSKRKRQHDKRAPQKESFYSERNRSDALSVETHSARYFVLFNENDKNFADALFANFYKWALLDSCDDFIGADAFENLASLRLLAAFSHSLLNNTRAEPINRNLTRLLFPFQVSLTARLQNLTAESPKDFYFIILESISKHRTFLERFREFLSQNLSKTGFEEKARLHLEDDDFKDGLKKIRKTLIESFKKPLLSEPSPKKRRIHEDAAMEFDHQASINVCEHLPPGRYKKALKYILEPLPQYIALHNLQNLNAHQQDAQEIPPAHLDKDKGEQVAKQPVQPAQPAPVPVPPAANIVANNRIHPAPQPLAPCAFEIRKVPHLNSFLYTRRDGAQFFGDIAKARWANPQERREIKKILMTLETYKSTLDGENYNNARRTIELIETAICENYQICKSLFYQFSRTTGSYLSYSSNPLVILHPEQTDMPVEQRAFCYFDTLKEAFKIAQEEEMLQELFTHGFFPPGDNTVCLEAAQKALASFLETAITDKTRKANADSTTVASDTQIYNAIQKIVEDLKKSKRLEALGGKTYNEFIARQDQHVEDDEASEKLLQSLREKADNALASLREHVLELTAQKLVDDKLIVNSDSIEKCVEQLCIF